jgi:O-antigen/teichoic acid export membrane protein
MLIVSRGSRLLLPRAQGGNLRAVVAGGSWTFLGTFVGRAGVAATMLVAAARLGHAGFGALTISMSSALTAASIAQLGLPMAVTKLVAESRGTCPPSARDLIHAAVGLTLAGGVVGTLAFLLLSPVIARSVGQRSDLESMLVLSALLIFVTPVAEIMSSILMAREQFREGAVYRVVRGGLNSVVVLVLLLLIPQPSTVVYATVAAEGAACLFGWRMLRTGDHGCQTKEAPRRGHVAESVRVLLRVSLPSLLASAFLVIMLWLGQLLLARQPSGLAQVGIFSVAYRWHTLALFIPVTVGSALLPVLGRLRASQRQSEARELFVQYAALTLVLSLAAGLITMVLSGRAMRLQGPGYGTGGPVLAILTLAVVPAALNNVLSQMAVAEDRIALWVVSNLALAGILIGTAYVLVPQYAAVGLAWAYAFGYPATCLVLLPVAMPGHFERLHR